MKRNPLSNHHWSTLEDITIGYRLAQSTYIAHVDADNGLVVIRSRWGQYFGILVKVSRSAGVIPDPDRTFAAPAGESLDECLESWRRAIAIVKRK